MTSNSYGGSSLSYRTRTPDATVSLKALVEGLRVEVEDHDGLAAFQVIQWAQVEAWMEAAGARGPRDGSATSEETTA